MFTGVVLISLALCADAVIGNVQEKTLKQSSISEMVIIIVHIDARDSFQGFADFVGLK